MEMIGRLDDLDDLDGYIFKEKEREEQSSRANCRTRFILVKKKEKRY